MSTKIEQLLDLIINEETEKANELFHTVVVEMSKEIYEKLIAEEDEEAEMDESAKEDDDEEQQDESVDLEDSYSMEEEEPSFDTTDDDATGDLGQEVDAFGDEDDEEMPGAEGSEDQAIFDIKNAIAELEAAFAELEQAQGGEEAEMGMDSDEEHSDEFGGEEDGEEEKEGMMGFQEGRRMTREYVEKVGNDWEKSGSQKSQGQYAGAGTGEKDGAPVEGKSPVSSGKGKPTTGATAGNILGDTKSGTSEDGTKPHGKAGGLVKNAQAMSTGNGNVPGGKMGVKNLSKVAGGHGAEKKGAGPGPVGSGSGDKAGQTSISSDKPFLKKL